MPVSMHASLLVRALHVRACLAAARLWRVAHRLGASRMG